MKKPRIGSLHCLLCWKRGTNGNGIQTTHGFFCYHCVKKLHRLADETSALRDNPRAKQEQAETE